MQGKGLIKFFLIAMACVAALQLLYFFPTNRVENEANEYATKRANLVAEESRDIEFRAAKSQYLDSMSSEKIFSIPGLASYTYTDLKQRQLNLGLDLKGGMSALLEVDLTGFLNSLAGKNANDPDFKQAIAAAKAAQLNDQSNFISLFVREYEKVSPGKKLANIFMKSAALGGNITLETSNVEIEKLLRNNADKTVELTYMTLKERIDKLGVVQPNVSLDKARDLILVEMPGIENTERARRQIEITANLQFWETYRVSDPGILSALQEADKRLAALDSANLKSAIDTSAAKLGGPLLSKLTLNTQGTKGLVVLGLADKNKMASVLSMLERPEVKSLFPQNIKFMWSSKPHQDEKKVITGQYELYAIKTVPGSDKAPLEGDVITNANETLDPMTGQPMVSLAMNAQGAKVWYRLTDKAYKGDVNGDKREIAIVLDDEVVTSPRVGDGAISGGVSQISGNFTTQEAVDLANILKVGKLPAKPNVVQLSKVGPSMGAENISRSLVSLLAGFLAVMLFMLIYYAGGGLIAVLALFANVIFMVVCLSSVGTVLTLPGIAGIVLTMGMSVDANVVIYERIKEELREAKSTFEAISEGFKMALPSIIDANVTTLIVAVVLSYFGLGPIKGFAVVLMTGILTSMFTAILLTKLVIEGYIAGGKRKISFWIPATKNTFANMNFDWVGNRKYAYMFSTALIVAGLISIFTRGFDLGVDFTGGRAYNVKIVGHDVDAETIRTKLTAAFGSTPIVKIVDSKNTFNITTKYLINEPGTQAESRVSEKLFEGLKDYTLPGATHEEFKTGSNLKATRILSFNEVGASVADDIKSSAFLAGIIALTLIFIYILFRFVKWQYSVGAIIALVHDALIIIGLFSLLKGLVPFSIEVDQVFVAAILTIVGYSINDTVIVFDRIREYLRNRTTATREQVINNAINSTFARTIFTSFTVLLVVTVLFIFGGTALKSFSFAMILGVIFGSYSSIFIATPIMIDLSKDDLKDTSSNNVIRSKAAQKA